MDLGGVDVWGQIAVETSQMFVSEGGVVKSRFAGTVSESFYSNSKAIDENRQGVCRTIIAKSLDFFLYRNSIGVKICPLTKGVNIYRINFSNALSFQTIEKLPDKVLLNVFSYLSHREICRVARVCKRWRQIAYDTRLWKHVSLRPEISGLHVTSLDNLLHLIR